MKEFNINTTVSNIEIKKTLESLINSPYKSLISEVIVKHLANSDLGLESLFLAFANVVREIPFKVLDEVYIHYDNLPSWRLNRTSMESILFKNHVKAKITKIDDTMKDSITYTFIALDYDPNGNVVETEQSYTINPFQNKIYLVDSEFLGE